MRTAALRLLWAVGVGIAGWSIYIRAFGSYGYTPTSGDAIALMLIATTGLFVWGK